jgi:hypothetical protein
MAVVRRVMTDASKHPAQEPDRTNEYEFIAESLESILDPRISAGNWQLPAQPHAAIVKSQRKCAGLIRSFQISAGTRRWR